MNGLEIIIAVNLVATFVIFCGLKLFDIGSDLAILVRKYGVFLGILFAFAASFGFLLGDIFELFDDGRLVWIIVASALGFTLLGHIADIIKAILLEPRKPKIQKKAHKQEAERASGLSVCGVGLIDVISGILVGATTGFSFTINNGTGIMTLCAFILLQLTNKVTTIVRYQDAHFTRRQNIAVLAISLCVSPIISILLGIWARGNYRQAGMFMAMAMGYLVYLCLYHLAVIVKKRRN